MSNLNNQEKKLLLIDGNGLAYRSYYAVSLQQSATGLHVNAILGFANLLLNALLSEKPTHVAVAFDKAAFTDRLLKFQSYNVKREEMPDELSQQLPIVEDFVRACGIQAFRMAGYEADDCLGTLAQKAHDEGFSVLIVSGDLELLQLVSPGIQVMTTRRGIADAVIYDEELVLKKYNLRPEQLADLRALAGDSSQNIGGVPGIGEVTARRLLSQYNSLQELFDSLDQLPAKWRNPLSENRDDAFEYQARASIRRDLPLDIDWQRCEFKGLPVQLVRRALGKADACDDFDNLLRRMEAVACQEEPSHIPSEALKLEEARLALQQLAQSSANLSVVWLLDGAQEVGVAIAYEGVLPFYICVGSGENELSSDELWQTLEPIFANSDRTKYVFGLRDIHTGRNVASANVIDFPVVSSLLDVNAWNHSLETIAANFDSVVYDRLVLFGPEPVDLSKVPLENKICWASLAADVMLKLGPQLQEALRAKGLLELYFDIELPFSLICGDVNRIGVQISQPAVNNVEKIISEHMQIVAQGIYDAYGREFDIDNDAQLGEFLFDFLGLLVPTRPKNGSVICAEVLISLMSQHALAGEVRKYRELSEFKRVFVERFMRQAEAYVHVNDNLFNAALPTERHLKLLGRTTVTGATEAVHKIIAVNSNLMHLPVRAPLRKVTGELICPLTEQDVVMSIRLRQLSLCVLANLAHDEVLLSHLEAGRDVQMELAEAVFADFENAAQMPLRSVVRHLICYYFSDRWLARALGTEIEAASQYLQRFNEIFSERYPQSAQFFAANLAKAQQMQELSTVAGRSCRIFEVGSRNHDVREAAEQYARAFAVEGSYCDIIRRVIVNLSRTLGSKAYFMPLFEEILVNLPQQDEAQVKEQTLQIIEQSCYGVKLYPSIQFRH